MDQFRNKVEPYSPKSSPRGTPIVSRQDTTGTLKTTISLGKNPTIVHSGPFYLIKEPPSESDITGSTNLMAYYGLEHTYVKFSGKRLKESLSAFLPHLPGMIDTSGNEDKSSLKSIIDKPPITGKEILPLNNVQLAGFRLHPGPLPERYRYENQFLQRRHKSKRKKNKYRSGGESASQETCANDMGALEQHEKKHKKQKRHDEDKEQRKKRKKEKKKKKQKHSPEHSNLNVDLKYQPM